MSEATGPKGEVRLEYAGNVAHVTFSRPEARNAMTFHMYHRLGAICEELEDREDLRAVVFRGDGGTFVAGTDISEFTAFETGRDGLDYEDRIERTINQIEALPAPTLAVVEGAAVGGGLALAVACDLRITTPEAKFGVPIAQTLGNCLSAANITRIERVFGRSITKSLLLAAQMIDGARAFQVGAAAFCVPAAEIDETVEAQVRKLVTAAPLTIAATKALCRRLDVVAPEDTDWIERVYGSADFAEGVRAFLGKRRPNWTGQ